jgi:mRNA-degrading endonuclease toxin of MazEF toxin-antitoxin module
VRQFEIWWADLPAPAGRRPVLLLSRDTAYSYLNRVLAVEITFTIRGIVVEMPLGRPEGLPKLCVANFDNVRSIQPIWLVKRIGELPASRHHEVKNALGHVLAWMELIDAE